MVAGAATGGRRRGRRAAGRAAAARVRRGGDDRGDDAVGVGRSRQDAVRSERAGPRHLAGAAQPAGDRPGGEGRRPADRHGRRGRHRRHPRPHDRLAAAEDAGLAQRSRHLRRVLCRSDRGRGAARHQPAAQGVHRARRQQPADAGQGHRGLPRRAAARQRAADGRGRSAPAPSQGIEHRPAAGPGARQPAGDERHPPAQRQQRRGPARRARPAGRRRAAARSGAARGRGRHADPWGDRGGRARREARAGARPGAAQLHREAPGNSAAGSAAGDGPHRPGPGQDERVDGRAHPAEGRPDGRPAHRGSRPPAGADPRAAGDRGPPAAGARHLSVARQPGAHRRAAAGSRSSRPTSWRRRSTSGWPSATRRR